MRNIITIGRQFGSGGREIGKAVADALNIPFYDKELLRRASQESGLRADLFEKADEKTSSILQSFAMSFSNGAFYQPNDYFTDNTLFQLQSEVLRKIVHEGSCVIVGRCADYILKDEAGLTSLFIHAYDADRVARICKVENISEKEALDMMKKKDKMRANYYNYYTDKTWGAASSYGLSLNSSLIGVNGCIAVVQEFIQQRQRLG
ncbi:MAG: cytidylate kinase-like family protein [Culturomica sp.]|jgi:cytidylate kinase|nr:cytidylate kinase-like family protein [Culturomica sp.]